MNTAVALGVRKMLLQAIREQRRDRHGMPRRFVMHPESFMDLRLECEPWQELQPAKDFSGGWTFCGVPIELRWRGEVRPSMVTSDNVVEFL